MELGRGSVVVAEGDVFEYFDELRKVIETARVEVFFIDPYLDANFVFQYLPQVAESVSIRLLGSPKKRASLLPAVSSFTQQHGKPIIVRISDRLHDRYLFVDQAACYLSGASFKDGAKNAPAVLTQITDAFAACGTPIKGSESRVRQSNEQRDSPATPLTDGLAPMIPPTC